MPVYSVIFSPYCVRYEALKTSHYIIRFVISRAVKCNEIFTSKLRISNLPLGRENF